MKKALAISKIVSVILAYNLWAYFDCYYLGIAITFVICGLELIIETKRGSIERRVNFIFLCLAISNLIDELFFDPKEFGANEYFIAVFIIVHQICLQRRETRNATQYE